LKLAVAGFNLPVEKSHRRLLKLLTAQPGAHVVGEATGGHERDVAAALHEATGHQVFTPWRGLGRCRSFEALGKIMNIKTGSLLVAPGLGLLIVVAGITGCVNGPFSSSLNGSPPYTQSTVRGGDHTQPVYTSPADNSLSTNLPAGNPTP
jgi:hypothetical protein